MQGTIKKPAPSLRLLVRRLPVLLLCGEDRSARLRGAARRLLCFTAAQQTGSLAHAPDNGWISGGIFCLQINATHQETAKSALLSCKRPPCPPATSCLLAMELVVTQ